MDYRNLDASTAARGANLVRRADKIAGPHNTSMVPAGSAPVPTGAWIAGALSRKPGRELGD